MADLAPAYLHDGIEVSRPIREVANDTAEVQRAGSLAFRHISRNQLPKPAAVNGLPSPVIRNVSRYSMA
jgi:hypothetical protein